MVGSMVKPGLSALFEAASEAMAQARVLKVDR